MFFSLNCFDWHLLPLASEEAITKSSLVKGRIVGDPSFEYEHTDVRRVKEGDEYAEEEVSVSLYTSCL